MYSKINENFVTFMLLTIKIKMMKFLPSVSFIAAANSIKYCSGIPHFVDSENYTLGVDVEKLEIFKKY